MTFDDILRPPAGAAYEVRAPGFFVTGGFVTYRLSSPSNRFYLSIGPHLCVGCMNPFVLYTVPGARNLTIQIVSAVPGVQVYDGGQIYYANAGDTVIIERSSGVTHIGTSGPSPSPSVAIDNVTYEPPATIRFKLDEGSDPNTRRIVIARHRTDFPYSSPAQKTDGRIEIHATAGAPGRRVYFRVVDPPDTSPYIPSADRKANDNVGGAGQLSVTEAVSDASDNVMTELRITDRYGGDNYRVEASTDADFRCAPECPRTGLLTAWKRVYLENDLMYRRGSFVARPTSLGDRVRVTDIRPFLGQEGRMFEIIHADAPGASHRQFYRERHVIGEAVQQPGEIGGHIVLQPGEAFANYYFPTSGDPVLADAVGLLTGNPADDYFRASDHVVQTLFAQAFVEYVPLAPAIPVVPYVPSLNGRAFADTWVNFAERWSESDPRPNHQHVITATRLQRDATVHAEALTLRGNSFIYLYADAIGMNQTLLAEVLAHEVAHLWRANSKPNPDHEEHCDYSAWNAPGKVCQARGTYTCSAPNGGFETCPAFLDGVGAFHYQKTGEGVDSEYRWIRERCEPVPNSRVALNGRTWMSYSPLPCR
ncbi:MAG TPA: hypothetical protein VGF48_23405 [Thermoanaerobaculia bacterium]